MSYQISPQRLPKSVHAKLAALNLPVKRAPGTTALAEKLRSLQEQQEAAYNELVKTCTHAAKDVEITEDDRDDTLGNRTVGSYYRVFCTVCKRTLLDEWVQGSGH